MQQTVELGIRVEELQSVRILLYLMVFLLTDDSDENAASQPEKKKKNEKQKVILNFKLTHYSTYIFANFDQ